MWLSNLISGGDDGEPSLMRRSRSSSGLAKKRKGRQLTRSFSVLLRCAFVLLSRSSLSLSGSSLQLPFHYIFQGGEALENAP